MEDNTTPAPAENEGSTQAPAVNEAKTLTQADIDKIVSERLARERKKLEKELEQARTEAEQRAQLSEAEKAKADLEKLRKELESERAKAVQAERLASLAGKVADPRAALKLLEDAHLDGDGNVDVPALLKAYPFLAPAQAAPESTLPGAPSGATVRTLDLEKALASGDAAAINAAMDAALKR